MIYFTHNANVVPPLKLVRMNHDDLEFKLDAAAKADLTLRMVSLPAQELVEALMRSLLQRSAEVGRDYDPEIGDTPILAGQMTSSRAHQCIGHRIRKGEFGSDEIRAEGRSLHLRLWAGATSVMAYSISDGDAPQMLGSDRKEAIVHETQEQLALFDEEGAESAPRHLVIGYHRDLDGVVVARVGVMAEERDFHWSVELYRRENAEGGFGADIGSEADRGLSHDERDVPDPELRLRKDSAEDDVQK